MTSLTCLTVTGAVLGHVPDAADAHELPGQSASALPESEPSPRVGILSAKGCFLPLDPSPRVCSRLRDLDRPQPVKAPSLRVVGHPLSGCAPRSHNCSRRRSFFKTKKAQGPPRPHRLAITAPTAWPSPRAHTHKGRTQSRPPPRSVGAGVREGAAVRWRTPPPPHIQTYTHADRERGRTWRQPPPRSAAAGAGSRPCHAGSSRRARHHRRVIKARGGRVRRHSASHLHCSSSRGEGRAEGRGGGGAAAPAGGRGGGRDGSRGRERWRGGGGTGSGGRPVREATTVEEGGERGLGFWVGGGGFI
jgi:hypothetical protein